MAHWYEKKWLVIVLLVAFFPAGLYALWKNSGFSKRTKGIVTGVVVVVFVAAAMNEDKPKSSRPSPPAEAPVAAQTSLPPPEKLPVPQSATKPAEEQGPAALQTLKNFRFQYEGRTIGIEDYIREATSHIAPNFHYGWLTKKNPYGAGYLVGYALWSSTTNPNKNFDCLWIVDGQRIIPVDTMAGVLAMDTPGLAKAEGLRSVDDYVNLFR